MDLEKIKVKKDLQIIFMGTPAFAVPVLEGLLENYKIRAVVTQPDKKVGREGKIVYSPIKKVALEHTLLILQPENIGESLEEIRALNPDIIITCAYGQILPYDILQMPRLGCINVHASLLPKYRGGAPIHRAIIDGAEETGITIMYMNESMDGGDIISQEAIDIDPEDTASTLHDKLSIIGRDLLLETLPSIIDGTNDRIKQDSSKASYGFVIKKEDERIHFNNTKRQVYNLVPELFDGQITEIYTDGFGVKVSNGEVVFTEVQLEGKNRMSGADFVRGMKNKASLVGKILD